MAKNKNIANQNTKICSIWDRWSNNAHLYWTSSLKHTYKFLIMFKYLANHLVDGNHSISNYPFIIPIFNSKKMNYFVEKFEKNEMKVNIIEY